MISKSITFAYQFHESVSKKDQQAPKMAVLRLACVYGLNVIGCQQVKATNGRRSVM
jgi:hypothetical protein